MKIKNWILGLLTIFSIGHLAADEGVLLYREFAGKPGDRWVQELDMSIRKCDMMLKRVRITAEETVQLVDQGLVKATEVQFRDVRVTDPLLKRLQRSHNLLSNQQYRRLVRANQINMESYAIEKAKYLVEYNPDGTVDNVKEMEGSTSPLQLPLTPPIAKLALNLFPDHPVKVEEKWPVSLTLKEEAPLQLVMMTELLESEGGISHILGTFRGGKEAAPFVKALYPAISVNDGDRFQILFEGNFDEQGHYFREVKFQFVHLPLGVYKDRMVITAKIKNRKL